MNITSNRPGSKCAPLTVQRRNALGNDSTRLCGPTVTTSSSRRRAGSTSPFATSGSASEFKILADTLNCQRFRCRHDGNGIVIAVHVGCQLRERLRADRFTVLVAGPPHSNRLTVRLDTRELDGLRRNPFRTPIVSARDRENSVNEHPSTRYPYSDSEVSVRRASAKTTASGVVTSRTVEVSSVRIERTSEGPREATQWRRGLAPAALAPLARRQDRPQHTEYPAFGRPDSVHVPTQRVWQREQPKRFGRRRAVDDHNVPVAAPHAIAHLKQRKHFFSTWQHGEFFRFHRVDPAESSTSKRYCWISPTPAQSGRDINMQ